MTVLETHVVRCLLEAMLRVSIPYAELHMRLEQLNQSCKTHQFQLLGDVRDPVTWRIITRTRPLLPVA